MAFDQATRKTLQNFVSDARALLATEFTRQLQNDYGMNPDTGEISSLDSLSHLNDTHIQTARLLRDTKNHYQASSPSGDSKQILNRIVREQAFTVLNRLCALRMAETRGILLESIGKAYSSKGFELYKRVAGTALGEIGDTYRAYLFSLFDEFAYDLAVLFDRYSPMGRLFPRESVLLALLDKINAVALEDLWGQDETIGWIYQYFNSVEERRQMRSDSPAPRDSRELAVRNQFFTPRYVVEFLTDNTLGRIWYEMTKGSTRLIDHCRYLVRRPNEIFLQKGEPVPEFLEPDADLSKEELLNQPVSIEHRPIKDPRQILMLDPACGSMHFGLYAFDLFEIIYQEAWDLQSAGLWPGEADKKPGLLTDVYATREDLLRDVPRLIIENNIHGVDIDPRAVQIAGLSLWLRAQRSWKDQGVKPRERSRILKSNIVCAEPMPGEKALLHAFSKGLKPAVLGQLLEIIFEKMKLAGEAGSLLKIEEEIDSALETAREEFNKEILFRNTETGYLPGMAPKVKQLSLFDFADLPSKTQFWDTAEEKIIDALNEYAEHAEEADGGRRRLFAEDAAKGFAFIDLCRKRYDVVLMNPPFGNPPTNRGNVISLPAGSCSNLYAAFVIDGIRRLCNEGLIGAITDRTFILLSSYEPYRNILTKQSLIGLADFDWGVLDSAQVASCAYIIKKITHKEEPSAPWFIDCRNNRNKSSCLTLAMDDINKILYIPISIFIAIPTRPISHWAPKAIRNAYSSYSALEPFWGVVRKGLSPGDSPRFVKLWWEVPFYNRGINKKWAPYANGGSFSPFYRVTKEVVEWDADGRIIKSYRFPDGRPRFVIRSENLYSSEGLTYGKRGEVLNVQVLPAEQTFSNEGYFIGLDSINKHLAMLGYLNSAPARYLINMVCGLHKEVGALKTLPIPESIFDDNNIINYINIAFKSSRMLNIEETNQNFFITSFNHFNHLKNYISKSVMKFKGYENDLYQAENEINKIIAKILRLDENDLDFLVNEIKSISPTLTFEGNGNQDQLSQHLLSIVWGVCVGRWDIRYATGEKIAPDLPDPFDPLPVCPSGMLQNAAGLPAEPKDVPDDYPIRITWSGIMVDDEGHPEDILTRVREVMEVIWPDTAGQIEQEACEILEVTSLRDYFSKPGRFFADHLKRYSKSRRQAPIYWPLSTPSGSYTLWLYYHRLTDEILYTGVNDFVEPKLKQVSQVAEALQRKTGRSREEENALEKNQDLKLELTDFRDELLRIAKFWKPDLNDGVQITAAPLWKLFQHRPWQNKLKETWEALEKGEYDWAHLAYSVWPARVIRASHTDRSLAIAHDLEDDLWEEIEDGTDREGNPRSKWVPRPLSENEMVAIIQKKTNKR